MPKGQMEDCLRMFKERSEETRPEAEMEPVGPAALLRRYSRGEAGDWGLRSNVPGSWGQGLTGGANISGRPSGIAPWRKPDLVQLSMPSAPGGAMRSFPGIISRRVFRASIYGVNLKSQRQKSSRLIAGRGDARCAGYAIMTKFLRLSTRDQ